MFTETFYPATPGPVVSSYPPAIDNSLPQQVFHPMPINLTAAEIRELVREVLG